ncbi:Bifunctional ligase/repressor BirA [Aliarcobacter thereius]|uniref:Bifunctional ligase/repressor BirA n=2 Tax=Aliarcobacter thereius TaxID=544718 RepID=A0A1C0B7R0_9BACT|nr:biotin--[acetyl-CoA-carboxylase] ligase [Aliarcobacter thereius]OCL87824.1 Bifunctional ligase/repressor BirA [Aliarcobacter thereius]OCL94080.1 Bifunctional ligase/repressor BirA [Aliarcobacter thereius]OCL95474.1 Bifunctional ligase/repressor BirA [Aliarcobacter thereius LMG 24486]OCL99624.1 Bifunctional ligase/repressor BirA [Aliarcobacter thereius]QBF16539.1 biotin-[acetyl-CoA-carboxylase] ligase [Aliarcobacter thereius LMG 24486]
MKILRLKTVDSTQKYLKEYVEKNGFEEATCILANMQTDGVGSRGNSWSAVEGNLLFSFVVKREDLPEDLPLQSATIYFTTILKDILSKKSSKLFIKWPNDFYLENKKIGGAITSTTKDFLFCGIGLNLVKTSEEFGVLDIEVNIEDLLKEYFEIVEKKISWKQIFSIFQIEFRHSKEFQVNIDGKKHSLASAILNSDGSIQIEDKKVFSLR